MAPASSWRRDVVAPAAIAAAFKAFLSLTLKSMISVLPTLELVVLSSNATTSPSLADFSLILYLDGTNALGWIASLHTIVSVFAFMSSSELCTVGFASSTTNVAGLIPLVDSTGTMAFAFMSFAVDAASER